MNFLAHVYLSKTFDDAMVGNLMADFVKGNPAGLHSREVCRGIALHRSIDAYTDAHPVVRESKARLSPTYRHYAGVIVDIFYDHFLAVHWEQFNGVPLPDFARAVYRLLNEKKPLLTDQMRVVAKYMQEQNWLVGYAQLPDIERVFQGMARRTRFVSGMERATEDLRRDYAQYEAEFFRYFPDLIRHVEQVKAAG
ncbi:MAG TPA: ACP phosphodiesterase [Cytophagales bacterium]